MRTPLPPLPPGVDDENRQALIDRLCKNMQRLQVDAVTWAFLWVSDITNLEEMVELSSNIDHKELLAYRLKCVEEFGHVMAKWTQTWKKDSPANSTVPESNKLLRDPKAVVDAKERDKFTCVITGTKEIALEGAYIVPRLLGDHKCANMQLTLDNFWDKLRIFFTEDRVSAWHDDLVSNWTESVWNIITLREDVHAFWTCGAFALEPLPPEGEAEIGQDLHQMKARFHWLRYRQVNKRADEELPISARPELQCEVHLDRGMCNYSLCDVRDRSGCIKTGKIITFTSADPERLELPSRRLLQMQFLLNQVAAMSAIVNSDLEDLEEDPASLGSEEPDDLDEPGESEEQSAESEGW